jgi:hypothetical protein
VFFNREIVFNTKRDSGEWTSDFEVRKNVTAYAAQQLFVPGARFVIRLAVIVCFSFLTNFLSEFSLFVFEMQFFQLWPISAQIQVLSH